MIRIVRALDSLACWVLDRTAVRLMAALEIQQADFTDMGDDTPNVDASHRLRVALRQALITEQVGELAEHAMDLAPWDFSIWDREIAEVTE